LNDEHNISSTSCFICHKSLVHLDETRQSLHINRCLDEQETNANLTNSTKQWAATVDCPLCGVALQPGPVR
jgi:hypothetical protein